MKEIRITINEDGTTDIDFREGYKGTSCIEKSREIELLLGAKETTHKKKDSYYEEESVDDLVRLRRR